MTAEGRDRLYFPQPVTPQTSLPSATSYPAGSGSSLALPASQGGDQMSIQEKLNAILDQIGLQVDLDPLRGFINAILKTLQGDLTAIPTWIASQTANWLDDFNDWTLGIGANFADLKAAFDGTYTGTDPALGTIQTIVSALRGGLTGLIDWSRIPQLSLSQLTNQPGPNLLSGFGDFASEDTMDGGGDWTWDGTVGGGSARATGSGARKVLTSELVAVSEGQQMTAAGKVRWSGASGSGAAMQLIVMPFVGDTAQAEVVISNITSPPASSSGTFVALSGSYTPATGVTGVRVRITAEAALTAGTVWWDDVTLRKVATSLPQQFISGLEGALSQLGADVSAALGWIKDLIQRITGRARTTLEDALTDAATFATQLRTLLLGGSVPSPLPNLTSLVQLGQSQITNLVSDLGGKASTAAIDTLNTFIQNLVNAILQALRGVPVVGGTLADIIADLGGVKDTADTAQQQIATGAGGQLISAGVLDGVQYQLTIFTANGTFTPPTPPTGYVIDYFIASAYKGGDGGARGNANSSVNSRGGVNGGRATKRITVAQMGTSQPVTVGAGGAKNSGAGGDSYLGSSGSPLVKAVSGASSIPSQYGDIASSSRPGSGGNGQWGVAAKGESSSTAEGGAAGGVSGNPGGNGAAGNASGAPYTTGGGGGGGGGYSGAAGKGGDGGAPGGGGGGGGASGNTNADGGVGARGQVDVTTFFKPNGS